MRLCVGTSKGIVVLDPDRAGVPLMVLADPSSIWCMAQDCRDPNLIYVGAGSHMDMGGSRGATSLFRSVDGGRTWTGITPHNIHDEEVWALATQPDRAGEVLIGTARARLFKSLDRGRDFEECQGFLDIPGRERWTFPVPPHLPHVRSITFDPSNPSTMYVGVEEGGVIRSRDRAVSFEIIKHGIDPDVHCVAVDPRDPRTLYAATGGGFYRSENAGASWRRAGDGLTRSYAVPVAVHPRIDGIVYTAAAAGPPPTWASGANGASAILFRSLDHGRTFHPIAAKAGPMRGMVMRILQSPADSDEVFAVTSDGTVIRSRDCGQSVAAIATKLPPAYDFVILP
ncbi:MAG: exo-alpha-sialidase [Candidatus Binataceae bacterium]|jgi:hypothetical protein